MSCFDINMECIKTNREHMYKAIRDFDSSISTNRLSEIKTVPTRAGGQAVIIKYLSMEYRLNSLYDSSAEANQWVEQYQFKNLHNVVPMFGFGNGEFARAIIGKMREDDNLLIYEPCADIFLHVLHNYDITDIISNSRVNLAVEKMNEFDFHSLLQGITNITNVRNQTICIYPQYDKIFPESCMSFWKEIKDNYQNVQVNINTGIMFGKNFIDNTIKNLRYLSSINTIVELKEVIPRDIPAIIVAAGPSVERQIEELKKIKGRAVIIAVDRILDYLLDEGLEPDFIMTLDPIKPIEYFSRRTDLTIPLLYFSEANYKIIEIHKGKKILCNSPMFLDKMFTDHNKIPPKMNSSASVATAAFTACVELGFKNIVLVGQDLAFDGTHTHAGGIAEKIVEPEEIMVEDINGNMIKSRYDWKLFITWYKDFLTYYPKLTVIDAKDKGAKIKGTIVMPLHDAADIYCNQKRYNADSVKGLKPTFSCEEFKNFKDNLYVNLDILDQIKEKSKKAIAICDTLIKESKRDFSSNHIDDLIKKLGKINLYITKQPIFHLMDLYVTAVAAHNLSEMYQFTNDIEKSAIQIYEKSKYIFKAMIEASDYIKPKLKAIIDDEVSE